MTAPIGSLSRQVPTRSVTTATATATLDDYQILCDTTSNAIALTLFPWPGDGAFYELEIVKTSSDANAVTISDGTFTFVLTQPQSVVVQLTASGVWIGVAGFDASGSGDVSGPATSTDGAPALFNGTTGKVVKNSTPTGTGNPVLQTSPTLTTPVIGVATGTSLTTTGLIKSSSPTTGIGYATGAGSTVAQGSNRTTGVTIDAITGAITLISAAGSATPASFTVTNAAVAATDVIIVNQKSGTDLYEIFVTAVGTGSFRITSFTTGGTTTETPVFNFAVIKGVAA